MINQWSMVVYCLENLAKSQLSSGYRGSARVNGNASNWGIRAASNWVVH